MAFLKWEDRYSVKVPEMDRQHQHLVGIINRLHDEMTQGAPPEALAAILKDLIRYTQVHFRREEELMASAGYPSLDRHKREHQDLTNQVLQFQSDLEAGRLALSISLLNFLKSWLRDHIVRSDTGYAEYVNPAGSLAALQR
jgi:hemerythrin